MKMKTKQDAIELLRTKSDVFLVELWEHAIKKENDFQRHIIWFVLVLVRDVLNERNAEKFDNWTIARANTDIRTSPRNYFLI